MEANSFSRNGLSRWRIKLILVCRLAWLSGGIPASRSHAKLPLGSIQNPRSAISTAFKSALALFIVSSHSSAGSESATIPAPA